MSELSDLLDTVEDEFVQLNLEILRLELLVARQEEIIEHLSTCNLGAIL